MTTTTPPRRHGARTDAPPKAAGSGWYETDFKKDGDKKRNLADGGEGAKPAGESKPPESAPAKTDSAPAKTESKPATPSSTSSS